MGLSEKLAKAEHAEIKAALTACKGNIRAAAERLGVGQSTLQDKVRRNYPDLGEHADLLKKRNGQSLRGRIANRDGKLSRSSVRRAWRKHKTIAATARALGIPASTLRTVLIEYGFYKPTTQPKGLITIECRVCDKQFDVSSLPTTTPEHRGVRGAVCRGSHKVCEREAS